MESSDNENHATKFVNDLKIIEEKAAAQAEVGRGGRGGGGIEVKGEEQEKVEEEGEKVGGEEGKQAGGEGEQEKAEGQGQREGTEPKQGENKDEDYWRYIPLLNAALGGDWDSAKRCIDEDESALTANITNSRDTALHIAIMSGRSIEFVKKLVDLMPPEALALRNSSGCTALISAALYGNTKAAVILVEKHPTSLYIRTDQNSLPLHCAANNGHKDTLLYLLSVTKEDDPVSKPLAYPSGALLLFQVIDSEFYDIALNLVGRHPELATSILNDGSYALNAMARKASAFPSGIRLNRWQRLIYSYVPVKLENYADQDHNRSDIENSVNCSQVITQKHSWARILGANFPNSGLL